MDDKLKRDAELLNEIIESIKTDEFLESIHKEERNLNERKYEAFKKILLYLKESFGEDEDIQITFGLLDRFNPRSGWISVYGEDLEFQKLYEIAEELKEVSNIEVLACKDGKVEISMMMYEIVTLV